MPQVLACASYVRATLTCYADELPRMLLDCERPVDTQHPIIPACNGDL